MTRSQVRFLLGTPLVDDPFHRNRWDYVYYIRVGRQDATFTRWVTIHFDGETVREIVEDPATGSAAVALAAVLVDLGETDGTVDIDQGEEIQISQFRIEPGAAS